MTNQARLIFILPSLSDAPRVFTLSEVAPLTNAFVVFCSLADIFGFANAVKLAFAKIALLTELSLSQAVVLDEVLLCVVTV